MPVVTHLVSSGSRLFSARSRVPLLLLPIIWFALPDSFRVEQQLGHTGNAIVQWTAFAIAMAGVLLRCVTVATAPDGTSSRDTRAPRAPSLNTTGMYSIVRHPLYIGNALIWTGIAASTRVWWLVVIVALAYALYIERVIAFEESFLDASFGEVFRAWADRTRAVVPRLSAWRPARRPILWRRIASEHNGLLTIAVAFPLLQMESLMRGYTLREWLELHSDLMVLLAFAVLVSAIAIGARRWPARAPAPDPQPIRPR